MPHTIFLISPANLRGERAALIFNPKAAFPLAEQLRAPGGAPLGDVYSFVSGLYFRGKKAYAEAFGRAPPGLSPGLVISPSEGLRFLYEPVTLPRLQSWAHVSIDEDNPAYTEPLLEHATALLRALGAQARFVLLGSVATDKYVKPLGEVFGKRLLFPGDFVGRGDMSRGSLLLAAARSGVELAYVPVVGAERHGRRPARVAAERVPSRRPRAASSRAPRARPVLAAAERAGSPPQLVILIGLPGAGKSTFREQQLPASHTVVSKDLLRRSGQPERMHGELLRAALAAGDSVVVDDTNVGLKERERLIALARAHGALVTGYLFEATASECAARNALREGPARIPAVGIFAARKRLVLPAYAEGFDALFRVRTLPGAGFDVTRVEGGPEPGAR